MLNGGVSMTSTRKMLLGTAAATMAVTSGGITAAEAADAAIKKAPPIQFVRICDQYGYGFFQIPGSSICLQLRGQAQSDNDYQPTHDLMFLTPNKTTGSWDGGGFKGATTPNVANGFVQLANQQDNWGYEVTAKPRFDARTETSLGTFRAYVELKLQLDAGAFLGPPGPGGGSEIGAGNKSELYRGYMQWAGWSIGEQESVYSLGGFKVGDIANVTHAEKVSGWAVNYTWTPSGPGVPPKRGSAPVPDGWSFAAEMLTPIKVNARNQIGGGCAFADVALAGGNPGVGVGTVCATNGPLSVPDFTARLHYEADPTGKDENHNDQFSVGTWHLSGAWHQITQIAVGSIDAPVGTPGFLLGSVPLVPPTCGGGTCTFGPTNHDHGWAVNTSIKFFVPMWPGTTLGARRSSDADNIWLAAEYCNGALAYCGMGTGNGNVGIGDAYWPGGFLRDDEDGRIINNGLGGFYEDKEKELTLNAQYHFALTNCDDPITCLVGTLHTNYGWVTPGNITKNVDWTLGGLGNARFWDATAELSWGTSRNGTTKPVFWRVDFELQYRKIWQDLPCNNNGVTSGACGTPTALPLGIAQDPSTWVWRTTLTFDW
jgi:hypothetical protein